MVAFGCGCLFCPTPVERSRLFGAKISSVELLSVVGDTQYCRHQEPIWLCGKFGPKLSLLEPTKLLRC